MRTICEVCNVSCRNMRYTICMQKQRRVNTNITLDATVRKKSLIIAERDGLPISRYIELLLRRAIRDHEITHGDIKIDEA